MKTFDFREYKVDDGPIAGTISPLAEFAIDDIAHAAASIAVDPHISTGDLIEMVERVRNDDIPLRRYFYAPSAPNRVKVSHSETVHHPNSGGLVGEALLKKRASELGRQVSSLRLKAHKENRDLSPEEVNWLDAIIDDIGRVQAAIDSLVQDMQ